MAIRRYDAAAAALTTQSKRKDSENMMEKGATKFDKLCHKVFGANGNGFDYLSRGTGVSCRRCGGEILYYYCEERLYLVDCPYCSTKALVMARSAEEAACKTFGHKAGGVGKEIME